VPFDRIHACYREADGFLFASSCENMPIILIEAMASGLPIVCSNRGPMPEVLRDGGLYFDPQSVPETVDAIRTMVLGRDARTRSATRAGVLAREYQWERTARETMAFIREVASSGESA
jgi:glycosyltransferase involved in cell wall biosynthesis